MADKAEAVAEFRVNVPAGKVYEAWLDPAKVRLWMASALREMGLEGEIRAVEIDARPGGRFTFVDIRKGTEARHWGEYRDLSKPAAIEFTWVTDPADEADPSVVRISLTDDGEGCAVKVVHTIDTKWAAMADRIAASWQRMLRHAADLA